MPTLGEQMRTIGNKSKIPDRYEKLKGERSGFLERGQEYSRMTLPYLLPETTKSGSDAHNQHGFQGIGAQVSNHLSNKLVMTLFPPQRSFFKMELAEEAAEELEQASISATDLTEILVEIEKNVGNVSETIGERVAMTMAMKQLIVGGNVTLHLPEKGNMQAIPLDRYVTKRGNGGELEEYIQEDTKTLESFEPHIQMIIKANGRSNLKAEDEVKLYTQAKLVDGMYRVRQSAFDTPLGEEKLVKPSKLPWIPLRWNSCYGEDYGRGLVEDHAGDFAVIEYLTEAVAKGAVLMADVKYLVKPGSIVDINHITSSPTGEFVTGNADDISVLQLDKFADFSLVSDVIEEYRRRIGQAFLLNSANRRDAERVTTVELRIDANELETSLGGIYSLLAQELQKPLAMLYLSRVSSTLSDRDINPVIVTGIEALGRAGELDKIYQFSEAMQVPGGWPQGMQERIKWDVYARKIAASLSLTVDWIQSEEEYRATLAAQQQSQAQQLAVQEGAKALPGIIENQVNGE